MSIERTEEIQFHPKGTLDAVTRWIAGHADGIAEWMKNVRRQYQADRANVSPEHRMAIVLLRDAKDGKPARIGVLDVGGATLEDVTAWRTWQDPNASRRASPADEEQTQGNGGKAYMYRLFAGPTRILGICARRRNCQGFEGEAGTVERGTPGWVPNLAAGRDVEISSFDQELHDALAPYNATATDLPERAYKGIKDRQAFTLVEGQQPDGLYKGRIDADELIAKIVRHEQSTLCLEQVDFFVMHNGRILNDGKRLELPPITPYAGIQSPVIHEIPDQLPLDDDQMVSTTEGGTRDRGRLILHTSAENMQAAWKNLRPRWQIIYQTQHQMIGTKPVSEVAGPMPGAQYIYGTVQLPALEPAYVEHGRRRPKQGPLMEALDRFTAEKIKELARLINAQRQEKLDDRALDEVHEENRKLDELKNRFLPDSNDPGNGGSGTGGTGPGPTPRPPPPPTAWGTVPDELVYSVPEGGINVGKGISVVLRSMLQVVVKDSTGRPVRTKLEWFTSDHHIASVSTDGTLQAIEKGACDVSIRVKGTSIKTERIPVRVWNVDHVLLTPRMLDVPLGTQQQILAEVTDDDGKRSTDVLLDWRHDADDQLLVRINRRGVLTGNRLGRTAVTAGAGAVWARIPVEVTVTPNPDKLNRGSGFPRLLLTGRDLDPATEQVREGDPDQPPLWQDPSDFVHNVWWLNVQSPEAAFAFRQRAVTALLWRTYHAERVIDMVVQVWMIAEFTRKGDSERPDFWANHRLATDRHRVRLAHEMWKRLEPFVSEGDVVPGGEEDSAS